MAECASWHDVGEQGARWLGWGGEGCGFLIGGYRRVWGFVGYRWGYVVAQVFSRVVMVGGRWAGLGPIRPVARRDCGCGLAVEQRRFCACAVGMRTGHLRMWCMLGS